MRCCFKAHVLLLMLYFQTKRIGPKSVNKNMSSTREVTLVDLNAFEISHITFTYITNWSLGPVHIFKQDRFEFAFVGLNEIYIEG